MNRFRIPLALLSAFSLTLVTACGMNADEQRDTQDTQAYDSYEPVGDSITIPAGTELVASLDQAVSTDENKSGDTFRATVSMPLVVDGRTVMNSGSSIRGVLREVQESGDVVGRAHMTLAFETLVSSTGTSHEIDARPLSLQAATDGAAVIVKGDALGLDPDDANKDRDGNNGMNGMSGTSGMNDMNGNVANRTDDEGNATQDDGFRSMGDDANEGSILVYATHGENVRLESGQRVVVHFTSPMRVMVLSRN